jgi:tetratricopeptide (TPR) repeat protein
MYLRTPKRYTRGQRRSPISLRWLWLWILTPIVVFAGLQIYENRDSIAPVISQTLNNAVDNAQSQMATIAAPTALPTSDPTERIASAQGDWASGRIDSAVSTYKQVLDARPNDVEIYFRYTLGLVMEGKNKEAVDAAERTITANPFSSDAWAIRSMVLDRADRYGEAVASALRALELDPKNARAMAFLAMAYFDFNQPQFAKETIDKALQINPDSFEALWVRGWITQTVDFDLVTARKYFQEAYKLAPNLPFLGLDLANVNLAMSQSDGAQDAQARKDEALGIVRDIVEANPQNGLALFWMGRYYNQYEGNYSQAADYLSRCVENNPTNERCYALLGRVQTSMGQYQTAVESLQKAIDLGTSNAQYILWAGRAYVALGECPSAVPLLQQSYDFAQKAENDEVAAAAEDALRQCQVSVSGSAPVEATPEETPAP